jgi:uncharacterized protein (TIGR02300 family)
MDTARAQRGTKRTCVGCDERFYDLNRNPIVCPACGNVHGPEAFVKQRPLAAVVPVVPAAAAKANTDDDDLDLDEVGLDDDDTLIDDGDDLDDDDDDGLNEVIVDVDDDEEDV